MTTGAAGGEGGATAVGVPEGLVASPRHAAHSTTRMLKKTRTQSPFPLTLTPLHFNQFPRLLLIPNSPAEPRHDLVVVLIFEHGLDLVAPFAED